MLGAGFNSEKLAVEQISKIGQTPKKDPEGLYKGIKGFLKGSLKLLCGHLNCTQNSLRYTHEAGPCVAILSSPVKSVSKTQNPNSEEGQPIH